MKRKSLFITILSIVLVFSMLFAVGCNNNNSDGGDEGQGGASGNGSAQRPTVNYSIVFDDFALINGQALNLDAKLIADGSLVDGTLTYSVADSSVASINGGVITANKLGTTTVTVTASNGSEQNVASKTVNCSVAQAEGIVPNFHEYVIYISNKVHDVTFDTEKTVLAEVYKGGKKVENADVKWTVADQSIATLDENDVLKAVKVGSTYIEGSFDGLKTVKIPVIVAIPVLDTQINVVLDTRLSSTPVNSNTVLGNGKVIGRVVDVETEKELVVNNNAVASSDLKVGEYRCIIYDKSNLIGCEVNLIVADYVVDSKAAFQDLGKNAKAKYVAFTTDLINVGRYDKQDLVSLPAEQITFSGILNGLGHTVEGLSITTSAFGIFGKVSGATFKNIAFYDTTIAAGNAGIFFFQSNGGVTIDNVYAEVTSFAGDSWGSGALYGFNYGGKVEISNTIVVAEGDALKLNNKGVMYSGAISGRAKSVPSFVNTYVITSGLMVANGIDDPHSIVFDKINILPILYKNTESFIQAKQADNSAIDFSGFNDFWDLSKDVPCFK